MPTEQARKCATELVAVEEPTLDISALIEHRAEIIARHFPDAENQELRKQLWLRHGHGGSALYGDDGEMQCKSCRLDFKRDSVQRIVAVLQQQDLERVSATFQGGSDG